MRQFLKGMFEEMLGHEIPFVCLMINGQESFRAHIHEVQVQHRVWFSMEKPPFIFYLRHSGDIKKVKELSSLLFNLSLPAWDFDSKNCLEKLYLQNMLKTASKRKGARCRVCSPFFSKMPNCEQRKRKVDNTKSPKIFAFPSSSSEFGNVIK